MRISGAAGASFRLLDDVIVPARPGLSILSIHRAALHLIIFSDLCFSSRFYQGVLPDFGQRILLLNILLTAVAYSCIAVVRGHVIPVLLAVLASGLVVGQILVFDMNWSMQPNWSGAVQYSVFLSFVPFYIMARDGLANYVARTLSAYALLYVFIYIAFVVAHYAGVLPPQVSRPLLLNDVERGDRLFSYAGALAYAWYTSLGRVRERATVKTILLLFTCALANYLTLSRVYLLCLIVVTAMSIVGMPRPGIRGVCLGILFIISGALLYGMLDTRWNPFFAFAGNDSSGIGRGLEYQVTQDLLSRSPILGAGLTSSSEYISVLTGISFFAGSDLGTLGILLDFGILGLLLFFISCLIATASIRITDTRWSEAFFLKGCTLALYGSIAPVLFAPGGTFYFAAILGMWLAQKLWRSHPPVVGTPS